eukprot:10206701-Ditylum_brightwellii.AAC.1
MREDHGRPPAEPPWIKTTNPPTAMPHEAKHDLSKSNHHHAVNTRMPQNDPLDQKQQQIYMTGKPFRAYIREHTRSPKDNDT